MMEAGKNDKEQFVDNYIQTYSPYSSQPLGVNVSEVLNLAKDTGCTVNELREKDIKALDQKESKLKQKLENVADSYYGFVVAVMTYVNNKESRLEVVEGYMNNNPSALTSDILEFISNQDDFA